MKSCTKSESDPKLHADHPAQEVQIALRNKGLEVLPMNLGCPNRSGSVAREILKDFAGGTLLVSV
jgi:hypothetical protein